jgi:hypothetical protein
MNYKAWLLVSLFCGVTVVHAETKKYTVLGNHEIEAKVQDGMPLPAEKSGITIEAAGFALGEGKLIWAFDLTSGKALAKVVVEDVSGPNAIVLVEDSSPKLADAHWAGDAAPLALSKSGCPWLFEPGDTTKVFRFTVTLKEKSEPVVIYQPAIYPADTKRQLRQMAR